MEFVLGITMAHYVNKMHENKALSINQSNKMLRNLANTAYLENIFVDSTNTLTTRATTVVILFTQFTVSGFRKQLQIILFHYQVKGINSFFIVL